MKENLNNNSPEKDILGQDKQIIFIKAEAKDDVNTSPDYSEEYELPTIKTRYASTLIDVIIILFLGLGAGLILDKFEDIPDYLRIILFVVIFILYEPILVSSGCTIGQLFMNIRVRRIKDPEKKINILQAFIRTTVKVILGWISFLTITFTPNRRGIHDFSSGSVVIVPKG